MKLTSLLITCCLIISTIAQNNQWYVSQARGDDGNSGSVGSPFATIYKAWEVSKQGDKIFVEKGSYNQVPNMSSKSIHIIGVAQSNNIDSYPVITSGMNFQSGLEMPSVSIENVIFENQRTAIQGPVSGVKLKNVIFRFKKRDNGNYGYAFQTYGGSKYEFENVRFINYNKNFTTCRIFGTSATSVHMKNVSIEASSGIHVTASSIDLNGFYVLDNTAGHVGSQPIYFSSKRIRISNAFITGDAATIQFQFSKDVVIENSNIIGGGKVDVVVAKESSITMKNVNIFNSKIHDGRSMFYLHDGDITMIGGSVMKNHGENLWKCVGNSFFTPKGTVIQFNHGKGNCSSKF